MLNRTLPHINAFGTADISAASNIQEALSLARLDWDVKSENIFNEDGDVFPGFKANVRETDGKLLGVVSSKYAIVQNDAAFAFVDGLVADGFKFDSAGQFRDGKSIWVMGQLPQTSILGDDIETNLVFTNSHDGTSGVKIMMTPVRIVCSNMLNLALSRASRTWKTRHTGGIFSKLEEAKYTLNLANNYMGALKDEADRLANITITEAEIEKLIEEIFPVDLNKDSPVKIRNTIENRKLLRNCYEEADIAQFKGTAYGIVNAAADLASHRQPTRQTDSFYENSWNSLINGHPILDNIYRKVA